MLVHLQVRNLAVVRHLAVDFQTGMTTITGETGAGKSIALDALGLCLGNRADSDLIRPETDKAEVIASFQLRQDGPAQHWLREQELLDEEEPEHCVLRRLITREGRSKGWINGYPVNLSQLKQLAPLLVNIHGQHEHQLLTKPDHQLSLLDAYARHDDCVNAVSEAYQQWYQLKKQQKIALQQQDEQRARAQLLRYQVEELDQFALKADEFEELEAQHKRLSNSSALQEDSQFAMNALYEGEHNNAYSLIQTALQRLEQQVTVDAQLEPAVKLLKEASVQIEETARELRHYSDSIELDDEALAFAEQRMSQALQLAKKHHIDASALPQLHQRLQQELQALEAAEQALAHSDEAVQQAANNYRQWAAKLSKQRSRAAEELSNRISASMQSLNMPHGRFVIRVEHQHQAPATRLGTDVVCFEVTTNPGQPLQPLARVASGGELSRISLAIQVITAAQMTTPTLMFDEVDVGVSGSTAATVGKLLRQLGQHNQVICVTHLPQVAAMAHQQLRVEKHVADNATETSMTPLAHDDRVIELARLLGAETITATAKANAEELLASAS